MEIFEKEPYTARFQAKVVEIAEKGGAFLVRLDSTAFFPGGGGQGRDTGTIKGKNGEAKVTETYESNNQIWHTCGGSSFVVGEAVDCEIDWPRRHAMMKSHTAEHTFFHSLSEVFPGISMVKVQIAPEGSSIFARFNGELSPEGMLEAEKKTNEIIAKGLEVKVNEFTKSSIPAGTRAKLERIDSDSVRVVAVGDFDSCACAGIHVRNTSEIGALAVTGTTSEGAGVWKISFLVGNAAINHLLETKLAANRASAVLQTTPDKLEKTALNLKEKAETLEKSARELGASILSKLEPEKSGPLWLYSVSFSFMDSKKLIEKAGELIKQEKTAVVFANSDGIKGFLLLAKSQDVNADIRAISGRAFSLMDGKGGGKDNFLTGAGEAGKLKEAFDFVEREIWKALAGGK